MTADAALEEPLFNVTACVRDGFHQRRSSTVLLTFVEIAESTIPPAQGRNNVVLYSHFEIAFFVV